MNIFKRKKKEVLKQKSHNEIILDAGLYQLLVRYIDVPYNLPGVNNYRPIRSCPYILLGNCNGINSIKLNYDICTEDLSLYEFYEVMVSIYKALVKLVDEDPLKNIPTHKDKDHYIADQIYGICDTIMKLRRSRRFMVIVENIRQNMQIHSILKENRRKGLDLHKSVIFHECVEYMCEDTYNVTTITLSDDDALCCTDNVLLVYTGTYFDPAKRTAPTVPTLDYIIARSYYARNKIGKEIGYEENDMHVIYKAKARHHQMAHEFCLTYLQNYYKTRGPELAVLHNNIEDVEE